MVLFPIHRCYCRKCDEWQYVKTLGEIVDGPWFKKCGREMKQVELKQSQLDMFPTQVKNPRRK